MRRSRWFAILVLCAIALLVAIGRYRREPEYQGRSLTAWLRGFESDVIQARWQSAEAVRQIGTNALPWLIIRLGHKPITQESWWRHTLRDWLSKQSFIKVNLPWPDNERFETLAALDALGSAARPALPAVEKLLHETPPDARALIVLARLGPDAVPVLIKGLTNNDRVVRLGSRASLDMLQDHSEILFPKTAQDAEFARRTVGFNSKLLLASFQDYKATHPEEFLSNGMPRPNLPSDYNSTRKPGTNELKTTLPRASPAFE